ncbi:MAG TPA: isoprenylcysteine carboxylmethyltransferase family protein [Kofleriaceae bacterium]
MAESLLHRAFTLLRGLIYSAAFIWLWTAIAMGVRRYDDRLPVGVPPWLGPVGLALAVAGASLAATCIATFIFRGRGTPAPFDPPREFVATGPYRYVRNPMYVGAALVILGAGLAAQSLSIAALALAFLAIAHLFVVIHEEPALERAFGDSYQRYRASVHRWLIWPP